MTKDDNRDAFEQELHAALGTPAVYANRFIVTSNAIGVRIGFLERNAGSTASIARFSVYLSPSDAKDLGELLIKIVEPEEKGADDNG